MVLWEQGDITEGELGKIVHLDSGTLAPLLKRLEKQGLLTRSRLESNERKLLVTLTNAGEALKEKAVAVPEEMQGCILLSKAELKQLKLLLDTALLRQHRTIQGARLAFSYSVSLPKKSRQGCRFAEDDNAVIRNFTRQIINDFIRE